MPFWTRPLLGAAVALVSTTTLSFACGPFFPNTVLDDAESELLQSPLAFFTAEIDLLKPKQLPQGLAAVGEGDDHDRTYRADIDELESCFMADGTLTQVEQKTIADYALMRQSVARYQSELAQYNGTQRHGGDATPAVRPRFPVVMLPSNVPREFTLYMRGAIEWHRGDVEASRQFWEALLREPPKARHYRSTWAAFMLGRLHMESDPERAIRYFHEVQQLSYQGFKDTLGLAVASVGWEAYIELHRQNFERATELYLLQHAAGDCSGAPSLRVVAATIITSDSATLTAAARSEQVRPVITCYLLATGGDGYGWPESRQEITRLWLKAIEDAGAHDVDGADRLAWTAYQAGEMALARSWAERAPKHATMALWIRAKLALREGRTDDAKRWLKQVVEGLPAKGSLHHASAKQKAASELAALHMADSAYIEALDLLIRYNGWWDAAYAAERVLTTEELQHYVDRQWPENPKGYGADGRLTDPNYYFDEVPPDVVPGKIRYLLARRLAREERFAEARAYYPPHWRQRLDRYVQELDRGQRTQGPPSERGKALWTAARIARYEGMELLGTDLEPDWFAVGGGFDPEPLSALRSQAKGMKLAAPGRNELKRLHENSRSHPAKRFHYRYLAADLAWKAAELMPDDSLETAEVLCWGGTWLKDRDPKAADRFYKALVNRCRATLLGQEADRIRWFPAMKETGGVSSWQDSTSMVVCSRVRSLARPPRVVMLAAAAP